MKKINYIVSLVYFVAFIFIIFSFVFELFPSELNLAFLLALSFNLFNILGSFLAFKYSIKKTAKVFIIYNLGGMLIRLFTLLLAILISLKFLKIDVYGFILLFFIFYFAQLAAEIIYFNNFLKRK